MKNGQKNAAEVNIELPETETERERKLKAAEVVTMSGPLMTEKSNQSVRRKMEAAQLVLRLACLLSSVAALLMMTTAKQSAAISIYGFSLPVTSKWSFSDSFEYLVGVLAVVAVYSIIQLLMSASRLTRKINFFPSRFHVWLVLIVDQVFAYALMSAGSAASGVTNFNRTGIKHSSVPNFCKPLRFFCDHVAISIGFTFFGFLLLATSVVIDVMWLSLLV